MTKYVAVRMPKEAYDNFVNKKRRMEGAVKKIIRKRVRIPLTKVFIAISENPITLPDDYVIKMVKVKKIRKTKV